MTSAHQTALDQHYLDTRQAFDSVADQYAGPLGNNTLVQHMREVLWSAVSKAAAPGSRLLDLGCGTGLDAIHFARQGYTVTAIDWSAAMTAETLRAAASAGLCERIKVQTLGIHELDHLSGETFDCIYSDLGALNCVANLADVARNCALLTTLGSTLVFSVIGRYCPWEFLYYLLGGNLKRATVRFARTEVSVGLNGHTVWTSYYSPRQFGRLFTEQFQRRRCRALNLFLPPPYLIRLYERRPGAMKLLAWLDQKLGGLPFFNQAGDHFLLVLSRR